MDRRDRGGRDNDFHFPLSLLAGVIFHPRRRLERARVQARVVATREIRKAIRGPDEDPTKNEGKVFKEFSGEECRDCTVPIRSYHVAGSSGWGGRNRSALIVR